MAFTDYQYDNYVSRQLALAVLEKHLQFNGRYDYYWQSNRNESSN